MPDNNSIARFHLAFFRLSQPRLLPSLGLTLSVGTLVFRCSWLLDENWKLNETKTWKVLDEPSKLLPFSIQRLFQSVMIFSTLK